MTQLFETETYDAHVDRDERTPAPRHLRSIPNDHTIDLADRSVQWHLDKNTIETARKGIAMARQALKESAQTGTKTSRKAA